MIKLTETMLSKSIIDANAEVREVAAKMGFDFNEAKPGDRFVAEAKWPDGAESEVRFYRVHNNRGDRRVSIKGIKQHAQAGDTVTLRKRKSMILLGVERA